MTIGEIVYDLHMKIAHVVATFPPHIGGMGQVVWDEVKALAERGHEVTVFTLQYPGFSYSESQQINCHSDDEGGISGSITNNRTIEPLNQTEIPRRPPGLARDDKLNVFRLRPLIKSGDAGLVPQLFFKLKNFDVVHLHYPWYGGAEWVWLWSKLKRKKYVLTYHMDAAPVSTFKRSVQKVYDKLIAPRILRGAVKILVVNPHLGGADSRPLEGASRGCEPLAWPTANQPTSDAKDLHPPEHPLGRPPRGGISRRVIELSNPIDTKVFKPSDERANDLGLPPEWNNKPILLFVGNLMPVKRLDLLVEALAQLVTPPSQGGSRGVLDVRLLVVGGGYEEARYKKMVQEKGWNDHIQFVGRVNDKQKLAKYYNCSTATVVPSDAESFSLVTIESLACGTPVVGSDIPGIQGRIKNGEDGFLFTPGSVESLVEMIKKILSMSPEERKQMGERGRIKVLEKYGMENHVQQLEKIYQSF
ncbi:MAG: glycosyltransferase family 1 protein [Candidatus Magasanikbacteria bacterium]|nr:glycosyltransferase family 1 protein [Candidatus Magasanikbacteria bacterium]